MLSFTSNLRKTKLIFISFFCLFNYSITYSQDIEKQILDSYKSFSEYPKEVVYVHLNKSILLRNEMLGFSAYTIDKSKKELSKLTANLYCVIKNDKDSIIKSKLIKVQNGLANNVFKIDSIFLSGNYTFKAYTSWMLNFNEKNYYETSFKVLNNNLDFKKTKKQNGYTIQVLPESGHALSNTFNSFGIVVKDNYGFGLPYAKGKILDKNKNIVSLFSCNQFGLGKTYLYPIKGNNYTAVLDDNPDVSTVIENIKDLGFNMSLKYQEEYVNLIFKTNESSLKVLKNRKYLLTIHNGHNLKVKEFSIPESENFYQTIKNKDLFDGINIFTIFEKENKIPILERIYFKNNSKFNNSISLSNIISKQDSSTVVLKIDDKIDPKKTNNLSISVLPKATKSYTYSSNIVSQTYLEPYVKGFVENANYYFSSNDKSVKYNLDLLLITQGWSSYDWYDIFTKPIIKYPFENGIDIVANLNSKEDKNFVIYPIKKNPSTFYELSSNDKSFIRKGLFPFENEKLKISALDKKNRVSKPKLYIQFYPFQLYENDNSSSITRKSTNFNIDSEISFEISNFLQINKDVEVLDEVVIKANKEQKRRDSIQRRSWGNVRFLDDFDRNWGLTLAAYLSNFGYDARDYDGFLTIKDLRPNTPNNNVPLLILDDMILLDYSFLGRYTLENVDYIEINRTGQGYGVRGAGGIIKIKTDPRLRMQNSKTEDGIQYYNFPLTFSSPDKFYVPTYNDINSKFYNYFGVLDWKPNVKIDENGVAKFKISKSNINNYILFVEGVFNNNQFVSKAIDLN